jgi:hypothetical protein
MGRSASRSKGSLVWDGGTFLFFRLFAGGFFFVLRFRFALVGIARSDRMRDATGASSQSSRMKTVEQGLGQTFTKSRVNEFTNR